MNFVPKTPTSRKLDDVDVKVVTPVVDTTEKSEKLTEISIFATDLRYYLDKFLKECIVCLVFGRLAGVPRHSYKSCNWVSGRCFRCFGDRHNGDCPKANPIITDCCIDCYLPMSLGEVILHEGKFRSCSDRKNQFKIFCAALTRKEGKIFPWEDLYVRDQMGIVKHWRIFLESARNFDEGNVVLFSATASPRNESAAKSARYNSPAKSSPFAASFEDNVLQTNSFLERLNSTRNHRTFYDAEPPRTPLRPAISENGSVNVTVSTTITSNAAQIDLAKLQRYLKVVEDLCSICLLIFKTEERHSIYTCHQLKDKRCVDCLAPLHNGSCPIKPIQYPKGFCFGCSLPLYVEGVITHPKIHDGHGKALPNLGKNCSSNAIGKILPVAYYIYYENNSPLIRNKGLDFNEWRVKAIESQHHVEIVLKLWNEVEPLLR